MSVSVSPRTTVCEYTTGAGLLGSVGVVGSVGAGLLGCPGVGPVGGLSSPQSSFALRFRWPAIAVAPRYADPSAMTPASTPATGPPLPWASLARPAAPPANTTA